MGEAFIMGGGGGATIQHITATNATSNTFTLTNPKRSKCLVFGLIQSNRTRYNDWDGVTSSSSSRTNTLYGAKYSVYYINTSYPGAGVGGSTSTTDGFEAANDLPFTRNANSITISLEFAAASTSVLNATNTIDIYVVDYD